MPLPDGMTEQDLALLNPAERAIMEAGDDDETDELAALAGDDGDESAEATRVAAEAAKAKEVKDPDDKTGTDDKAKPEATTKADEEEDDALTFTAKTPADAAEQRTALETRKNEAFAKLMAGEIEPEAYQTVESEVNGAMEKLLQASITDAVTTELTQAQAAKAWKSEVNNVVKAASAEGLDYRADEKLGGEFDRLIKVFAAEAQQAGMDDVGLKASKWALQEAHRTMKARHPELVKAVPAATGKEAEKKPAARAKADLGAIPPSLKGAPIAASAAVGEEFAHMEGLVGAEQEKAFARLTKEQQDRWLDA